MWAKITYPFSNFNGCTVKGKVWSSSVICVMNQPSVSDWVVQVPLWPSGLGVGLWNRRPGYDPRTVRYICISWFGNLSSRLHVSNSGTRTLFDWRRVVFAFHSCNIRIVWGLWSPEQLSRYDNINYQYLLAWLEYQPSCCHTPVCTLPRQSCP